MLPRNLSVGGVPLHELLRLPYDTQVAFADLCEPVLLAGQRQCSRCGAQWRPGRYGLELAGRSLAGLPRFRCPDCTP